MSRAHCLVLVFPFVALSSGSPAEADDPEFVTPRAVANSHSAEASSPLIKPMLPESVGKAVCFSGTFSDRTLELEDWSRPESEPVRGLFQSGKPVMRPVPARKPGQRVTALTLSLTYDDRKSDYDWIYDFLLMATLDDGELVLFASGECPWYDKDQSLDTGGIHPGNADKLGCYIDCDGGGMGVRRLAGTTSLDFRFWGDGFGLRMSAGCGGHGSYRLGTGENDDDVPFLLAPAEADKCAPLVNWANER